jgi:hypothetical protein
MAKKPDGYAFDFWFQGDFPQHPSNDPENDRHFGFLLYFPM